MAAITIRVIITKKATNGSPILKATKSNFNNDVKNNSASCKTVLPSISCPHSHIAALDIQQTASHSGSSSWHHAQHCILPTHWILPTCCYGNALAWNLQRRKAQSCQTTCKAQPFNCHVFTCEARHRLLKFFNILKSRQEVAYSGGPSLKS